jgi:hypothetical protein
MDHFAFAPRTMGTVSTSLRDLTICCVSALYDADGRFDLLLGNRLVALELSGIDFDLCDAHIRALHLIGMSSDAKRRGQYKCTENKAPLGVHVALPI